MKSTSNVGKSIRPKSCQLLWFYPDLFLKIESEWTFWLCPGNPLGICLLLYKELSPRRSVTSPITWTDHQRFVQIFLFFFSLQSSQCASTWGIIQSVKGGFFEPWLFWTMAFSCFSINAEEEPKFWLTPACSVPADRPAPRCRAHPPSSGAGGCWALRGALAKGAQTGYLRTMVALSHCTSLNISKPIFNSTVDFSFRKMQSVVGQFILLNTPVNSISVSNTNYFVFKGQVNPTSMYMLFY